MANAVEKMVEENSNTRATDVQRRKSLTNSDNQIKYNREALSRLIGSVKKKLYGDNTLNNLPSKIEEFISENLKGAN